MVVRKLRKRLRRRSKTSISRHCPIILDGGFDICSTGGFAEIMLKEIEMVSIAKTKYVRISPKKLRLIVDILKDQPASKALVALSFRKTRSAYIAAKTLKQAVANAISNTAKLDEDELVISKIYVDKANQLPRFRAGAQGRVKPIKHRFSHLTIELDQFKTK